MVTNSTSGLTITFKEQGKVLINEQLKAQLPPEALELLNMMSATEPNSTRTVQTNEVKTTLRNTMPVEMGSPVKQEVKKYIEEKYRQPKAVVKSLPQEMARAVKQKDILNNLQAETDYLKKLTIYEEGVALGIIAGVSTKEEVAEIMKEFSKESYAPSNEDPLFFYSDICLSIYFNENNIVQELKFGEYYRGETAKGLKLGDHLDKAIEIYGPPKMKSPRGALWDKFAVFCRNNEVISIRIQR